MRTDKNQALKLRLAGRSYNEITKTLSVPKSTLSGWFTGLELSTKAQSRIRERVHSGSLAGLINRNKRQTHLAKQRTQNTRTVAQKEIGHLSSRDLLVLGVALYWAEGYKRPIIKNGKARTYHSVSLTNSDPYLVKVFLKFLRKTCAVAETKIIASVRIYQHQNEQHLLKFWSKITNIPQSQFKKFYYGISKSSQGKRPFNILPYGTIQISVYDSSLYHRIMGWIEGLK